MEEVPPGEDHLGLCTVWLFSATPVKCEYTLTDLYLANLYLLYILMRPLECTGSPFLSQVMCGVGIPSAWHTKRPVPARGRVRLSGHSTSDGGSEIRGLHQLA